MEIKALQELTEKIFDKKADCEAAGKIKTGFEKELKGLEAEALEYLEQHGLKNFDAGDTIGKIATVVKTSVKIEDKYAFFDWLKAKGVFESTVTISAPTATKIYNEEFDLAKLEGNIDFLSTGIPGLSEPSKYTTIRKTGAKK